MLFFDPQSRIEITFGVGTDMHGAPLQPALVAERLASILREACAYFGGATLLDGRGIWAGPEITHDEPCKVLVILAADDAEGMADLRVLCSTIKRLLNQSAVAVCISPARVSIQ